MRSECALCMPTPNATQESQQAAAAAAAAPAAAAPAQPPAAGAVVVAAAVAAAAAAAAPQALPSPLLIPSPDIEGIAQLIKEGKAKNIIFM